MKQRMFSSYLSSSFYLALLGFSLPVVADSQKGVEIHLSQEELQEIFSYPERSYVYVGPEVSNIAEVVNELSKLDENPNSLLHALVDHIGKGYSIGNYDAVAQVLEEAELLLQNHAQALGAEKSAHLTRSLNIIIDNVIEERFNLDADMLAFLQDSNAQEDIDKSCCNPQHHGLRKLTIKEKVDFLGRVKFNKHVTFKDDVTFEDDVLVEGDLTVDGAFTVADQVIACDLTIGCNLILPESTDAAHGNIFKDGPLTSFIHNFGTNNTFVGENAGNFTTSGIGQNSGFGVNTLGLIATGFDNTAVGYNALASNADAGQNVALGSGTLQNLTSGIGVAIGHLALNSNTTGTQNTAIGWNALTNNTTASFNTAVGFDSLSSNVTGTSNTAVGNNSLFNNTIGSFNSAVGASALAGNTTGVNNTALGWHAITSNVIGSNNTAVGLNALSNNTVSGNTAVGSSSLAANTVGTFNTAVGLNSLAANTVGAFDTAVGSSALAANTVGAFNTAVGSSALAANTIGVANTALGNHALVANTTGNNNVAIGNDALVANTIGIDNIAIGNSSLAANTISNSNVAIGVFALTAHTTGNNNIAIGQAAGNSLTAGNSNIYIGNAGLAVESDTIRVGTLGTQTTCFVQGISGVTTGLTAVPVVVDANGQLGTVSSMRSRKHNIQDMNDASSVIYDLNPVTFAFNGDASEATRFGLIAEEVQKVCPELVALDQNGNPYAVHYEVLPAMLVNELKKLAARVAVLENATGLKSRRQ